MDLFWQEGAARSSGANLGDSNLHLAFSPLGYFPALVKLESVAQVEQRNLDSSLLYRKASHHRFPESSLAFAGLFGLVLLEQTPEACPYFSVAKFV